MEKKKKKYSSKTITTGDPQYNIDQFNLHAGTYGLNSTQIGHGVSQADTALATDAAGISEDLELQEEKRNVRRYYMRPQNIWCSNKAEVLKALIDHQDENASIYTLNNLVDNDDVTKLSPNDIIYYYDDGILYDKNRVRIMDYDLKIRHEETRDHLNVETASDATIKRVYADRLTDATELEEANKQEIENEFNLDFAPVNAYGELLTEEATEKVCCICGEPFEGYGNNAEPIKSGKCCDACNSRFVIPARLASAEKTITTESLLEASSLSSKDKMLAFENYLDNGVGRRENIKACGEDKLELFYYECTKGDAAYKLPRAREAVEAEMTRRGFKTEPWIGTFTKTIKLTAKDFNTTIRWHDLTVILTASDLQTQVYRAFAHLADLTTEYSCKQLLLAVFCLGCMGKNQIMQEIRRYMENLKFNSAEVKAVFAACVQDQVFLTALETFINDVVAQVGVV